MSWLSFLFEGTVSVLLFVMILYCVKLNRLLGGLRERDAEIGDLLDRFQDASDRAEASVATLKSAGIEVERSIRTATERAEAARDDLVSAIGRNGGGHGLGGVEARTLRSADALTEDAAQEQHNVFPPEFFEKPDDPPPLAGNMPAPTRSDAERELLRVIRTARGGG